MYISYYTKLFIQTVKIFILYLMNVLLYQEVEHQ